MKKYGKRVSCRSFLAFIQRIHCDQSITDQVRSMKSASTIPLPSICTRIAARYEPPSSVMVFLGDGSGTNDDHFANHKIFDDQDRELGIAVDIEGLPRPPLESVNRNIVAKSSPASKYHNAILCHHVSAEQ